MISHTEQSFIVKAKGEGVLQWSWCYVDHNYASAELLVYGSIPGYDSVTKGCGVSLRSFSLQHISSGNLKVKQYIACRDENKWRLMQVMLYLYYMQSNKKSKDRVDDIEGQVWARIKGKCRQGNLNSNRGLGRNRTGPSCNVTFPSIPCIFHCHMILESTHPFTLFWFCEWWIIDPK